MCDFLKSFGCDPCRVQNQLFCHVSCESKSKIIGLDVGILDGKKTLSVHM